MSFKLEFLLEGAVLLIYSTGLENTMTGKRREFSLLLPENEHRFGNSTQKLSNQSSVKSINVTVKDTEIIHGVENDLT